MTVHETMRKMFPGLVPEDAYDDGYAEDVAGHVESGARIDPASDVVNTPTGIDHQYDGEKLDGTEDVHYVEQVGSKTTDELVRKATKDAKGEAPKQVRDAASSWNPQTLTLPDANARRLVIENANRKSITIYCSSGGPVSLGRGSGIAVGGPNTVTVPVGGYRTLTHTAAIWIVGPANAVVDTSEENYE